MDEPSTLNAGFPIVCSACGYEFEEEEEYLVVHWTQLKKRSSMANLVQVMREQVYCLNDCNGEVFDEDPVEA